MSSTLPVSRRTVARGVAWSVPLVAVSVAAPAFATSADPTPSVNTLSTCKCPGVNSPYVYNLYLDWAVTGTWTITLTAVTFSDNQGSSAMTVNQPAGGVSTVNAPMTTVKYRLTTPSNSQSTYDVAITYDATNGSQTLTGQTLTFKKVKFNPCDTNLGIC